MVRGWVFDTFELRLDERRLLHGGLPVALGARAFDLLAVLIEHRERVVAKHELLALVWPGLVVEENNLTVQVSALRKVLGAQALATVAGHGYRFVLAAQARAPADSFALPQSIAEAGAAARLVLPDRPSIAVLPFDDLGGQAQQDHLVDGVVEEVITELARFRSMFVIARNSSFSYRGRAQDVRTVARELGVRYVLHGSYRRDAQRLRVVATLVDAASGAQLWAERFDRAVLDIFAVQEELTRAIVSAIAPQVESGEFQIVRRARAHDLNAYELAMRARDTARRADKAGDAAARAEALRLAHAAVAIDPQCPTAQETIAFVHWQQIWAGGAQAPAQAAAQGLAAARAALALDAADHLAHLWKGLLLIFTGQHGAGLADLRRAHELNPNDALTLSVFGQYLAAEEDAATGTRHVGDALRLSPRDPLRWSFLNSLAWARFAGLDYAGAADAARQSLAEAPEFPPALLCLLLSQAALGDLAAARASFELLDSLAPALVAARLGGAWNYANPALVQRASAWLQLAAAR